MIAHEVVETHPEPDSVVIWLHGLGANGHDFVPVVPALKKSNTLKIQFLFPHAPARPVTVNGGMVMPAWFDIYSMDIDRKIDTPQIIESSNQVHEMIDAAIANGIASERIILAGFSQGGAVVFHAALTYPKKLGGLLALSTYFATADHIQIQPENANLPVLIQHGTLDPVVPELLGQKSTETLKTLNFQPEYMTYPMEHNVIPQQLQHIDQWFYDRLN